MRPFLISTLLTIVVLGAVIFYLFRPVGSGPLVPPGGKPGAATTSAPPESKEAVVTPQPQPLQAPAGQPVPPPPGTTGLPAPGGVVGQSVFIDGQVFLPVAAIDQFRGKTNHLISFRARTFDMPPQGNVLVNPDDLVFNGWPFPFHLQLKAGALEAFKRSGNVMLMITAIICPGAPPRQSKPGEEEPACNTRTPLALMGTSITTVDMAAVQSTKDPAVFSIPARDLVITKVNKPTDHAACEKSKHTISGNVVMTRRFLEKVEPNTRIAIVGIPPLSSRMYPFVTQDQNAKVTPAELPQMSKLGLLRSMTTITRDRPNFTLDVPQGFRDAGFVLYAKTCAANETDDQCTAAVFPLGKRPDPRENVSLFRLVPGKLEVPTCGTTGQVFYLQIPEPAAKITQESVVSQKPQELIPGAEY